MKMFIYFAFLIACAHAAPTSAPASVPVPALSGPSNAFETRDNFICVPMEYFESSKLNKKNMEFDPSSGKDWAEDEDTSENSFPQYLEKAGKDSGGVVQNAGKLAQDLIGAKAAFDRAVLRGAATAGAKGLETAGDVASDVASRFEHHRFDDIGDDFPRHSNRIVF